MPLVQELRQERRAFHAEIEGKKYKDQSLTNLEKPITAELQTVRDRTGECPELQRPTKTSC